MSDFNQRTLTLEVDYRGEMVEGSSDISILAEKIRKANQGSQIHVANIVLSRHNEGVKFLQKVKRTYTVYRLKPQLVIHVRRPTEL